MSEVKMDSGKVDTYDLCGTYDPYMGKDPNGDYVKLEDYDTLKTERDELKGKLEMAVQALQKIQKNHCGHPQDLKQHRVETAREALKEISK